MLKTLLNTITSPVPDERAYEVVAQELAVGQVRPGLWAKALADSGYDEKKAKARYVKLRARAVAVELKIHAKRLDMDRRSQIAAEQQAASEELLREEANRQEAARQEYLRLQSEERLKKVRKYLEDPTTAEEYALEHRIDLMQVQQRLRIGTLSGYVIDGVLYVDRSKR